MSRNGSGVYTLPAGNPVVTGTTISSTWANSTLTNIASALTDSLAADGQTTATGNLKMGNNRITGLADGIAATDAPSLTQVTSAVAITGGTINGATVGGTTAAAGKFTTLEATGVTTVQAGTAAAPAITTTGDTNTGIFFPAADTIAFAEGGTESMRIDSSGNVLVGTTSQPSGITTRVVINAPTSSVNAALTTIVDTTANTSHIFFNNPNNTVGSITTSGSTTSYGTSSDYRLKENITPMTGALATVALLKPVTYNWKVDGFAGQGFIAHELQEVVPDCVTGEKDGEQMQGVDHGKITPLLTAALQEALAKIESLEARLAVLESK
jgi:hypothetical protein